MEDIFWFIYCKEHRLIYFCGVKELLRRKWWCAWMSRVPQGAPWQGGGEVEVEDSAAVIHVRVIQWGVADPWDTMGWSDETEDLCSLKERNKRLQESAVLLLELDRYDGRSGLGWLWDDCSLLSDRTQKRIYTFLTGNSCVL